MATVVVPMSSSACSLNLVSRGSAAGEYNVVRRCPSSFQLNKSSTTSDLSINVISHNKKKIQEAKSTKKRLRRNFTVLAVTESGSSSNKSTDSEETVPSWAKPDSDEPPPWARSEGTKDDAASTSSSVEIPFYVYLLASTITAIAAIGSIFEYINQKPVFGVLESDSVFYAPVLGFFAFTGVPTSAFLWFKSVQAANKAAEEQDRRDGYR